MTEDELTLEEYLDKRINVAKSLGWGAIPYDRLVEIKKRLSNESK